ncbi:hypothetical protein [Aeromicrobium sp.]|uniref:hypothetical protein n=1 Tax=Aeromicrobium sp. TaxID=1871063 RepID=UPI0030C2128B
MRGSRAFAAAAIAGLIVLIAYGIDRVIGDGLARSVASAGRVVVVVGAVVCAGVLYQLWSVRKQHTGRDHAAVVAALLGGAFAASSSFSAPAGQIFGNSLTAAGGVAGLALGLYGSRPAPISTEGQH